MADQQPMTVEEHLERVLAAIAPLEVTHQPLLDALGLAAAEPVTAEVSLPGFDNSAMDGYAVRLADVVSATADAPVHLPVVGAIGAGAADLRELPEG
ncbi:MAG: molybdopterin molybdenumtransferase MoeA, partial [Actinomycetota bacterium]|nr:molybdopterin molybdenumtransferase MoeA [Actinomycetota bacterium]